MSRGQLCELTPLLSVLHLGEMSYNAGIFTAGGEACLIDPGLGRADMKLIAEAAGTKKARPRWLVLTHSHWDHLLGPDFFAGVPVVQQQAAVAVAAEFGSAIERQVSEWRAQAGEDPTEFSLAEPAETFRERLELVVGGERLELLHAPGHAEEQLVVYHAASGLLWAGDMLSDIEIPFVMQSLRDYRATLDRLAELEIRVLVPGHGRPTTDQEEIRRRLAEDRRYLAELAERVEAAVRAGRVVQEAVLDCQGMPFRLRDRNQGAHELNVATAFYELGGSETAGMRGWNRLQ